MDRPPSPRFLDFSRARGGAERGAAKSLAERLDRSEYWRAAALAATSEERGQLRHGGDRQSKRRPLSPEFPAAAIIDFIP